MTSCNSEIISHSAIILALMIAKATVGKDAIGAITATNKKFGSIAVVVLLTLYESGRLFYYSDVSQRLLALNNDTLATWLKVTAIPSAKPAGLDVHNHLLLDFAVIQAQSLFSPRFFRSYSKLRDVL